MKLSIQFAICAVTILTRKTIVVFRVDPVKYILSLQVNNRSCMIVLFHVGGSRTSFCTEELNIAKLFFSCHRNGTYDVKTNSWPIALLLKSPWQQRKLTPLEKNSVPFENDATYFQITPSPRTS